MGFSVVVVSLIVISWNMPLFEARIQNKLNKNFEVAENFAELVSKGKQLCLFPKVSDSVFPGGWRTRGFGPLQSSNGWSI